VGEVMAIGRNFEEAIQKAVRMVNPNLDGLDGKCDPEKDLDSQIKTPTDRCAPVGAYVCMFLICVV
jgi:hypothetical protein